MGYYSDVMVSTTRKGFEHLKAKDAGSKYPLFGGYGYQEHVNDGDSVVFGWSCIKWYHSFPEVNAVLEGLSELAEDDVPWEYIEVGEDGEVERLCGEGDYDGRLIYHVEQRVEINIWN